MSTAECVADGAAWFDVVYPEWASVVNVDKLDMGHGRFCVVGQTFGSLGWGYIVKAARTVRTEQWIVDHGLESYGDPGPVVLTDLWRQQIAARAA